MASSEVNAGVWCLRTRQWIMVWPQFFMDFSCWGDPLGPATFFAAVGLLFLSSVWILQLQESSYANAWC
jgi:hypothetical protein